MATRHLGTAFGRLFPELRPPLTPFGRLAVTHLLMVTGDAFMTVALAGSLFFSISPSAARGKVALYLLITMAPFAVVAPALGPLLDRSRRARRAMVMTAGASRVVLCLLMARDLHSLLLFPEAFGILVASKLYLVGKAALVPATVGEGAALVRANSRLALIAALAGLVGGLPAAAILKIPGLGAPWVLRADALVLALATVSASRLPRGTADEPAGPATAGSAAGPAAGRAASASGDRAHDEEDWAVLGPGPARPPVSPAGGRRGHLPANVVVASTAMAVLRGTVGLITFLLAFELRRDHAATWWYGAVLVASIGGALVATIVTPRLRQVLREENILLSALALVAVSGAVAFELGGGRASDCVLTAAIGLSAGAGKLAFDSMVQRDVAELARGRAFARFETRFQLAWVLGALVPVAISLSDRPGEVVVALASTVAAVLYVVGRRGTRLVAAREGATS